MSDDKKILDTLKALRSEITATQEQVRKQLETVDATIGEIEDRMKPGLRVANPARTSTTAAPFAGAEIRDTAVYAANNKGELDFTLQDLVMQDDLLAGFADPDAMRKNLRNIWEQNLHPLIGVDSAQASQVIDYDVALQIVENRSKTGLALTTLNVAENTKDGLEVVPVHIFRNNTLDKTLIVAGPVSRKLREAFNKANVLYVDRTASTAVEDSQKAVAEVLGPKPEKYIENRLIDGFMYRNGFEAKDDAEIGKATQQMHDLGFAKALVAPKVETIFPKYVVKAP